ncbi:MAG TPA: hypothetical protein VG407_18545 [Caulobacteraceae bacterium]|jgi:DNA-binding beta-propeller fold protein YncE|nr:hypothetical protein [Caulobacteraceae bacterium]
MRSTAIFSYLASAVAAATLLAGPALAKPDRDDDDRPRKIHLPTSKSITVPAPGYVGRTNSYPGAVALSLDGRYAVFLNEGYATPESGNAQSLAVLDLKTNKLSDFPDPRLKADDKTTQQSYFVGLAFSKDGSHLYASLASVKNNEIAVYRFAGGKVSVERTIAIPPQPVAAGKQITYDTDGLPPGAAAAYPAGLTVLPGDRLLVADNLADNAVLIDAASGRVMQRFDLSTSHYVPSAYPYTVIANRAGTRAWVSLWNEPAVVELDLATGAVARRISLPPRRDPTAASPHLTSMALSPDETSLYVAVSNAASADLDGVAVASLATGKFLRVYPVAFRKGEGVGADPIGIAVSHDGRRLYAASASLNAVAVFDLSTGRAETPIGFIPTEWYPSALAIAGDDLIIASAKGRSSGPNIKPVAPDRHGWTHPYIPTLIGGSVQRVKLAGLDKKLAAYTQQVQANDLLNVDPGTIRFAGGANPIKHVIYVLRENRTYDQIFGDLPVGDGDRRFTMYGAQITPNAHKLALQFGVLDNFYDSGEVSANGHLWSDGAATSDYMEKVWPVLYRGSERPEDFGNGLEQGIATPDDPGTGFLWDSLAAHGYSYRIYGEMTLDVWCRDEKVANPREGTPSPVSVACAQTEIAKGQPLPARLGGAPSPWPWGIPVLKAKHATKSAQVGHMDETYPFFALDYPDQLRADEFLREFSGFVAKRGTPDELPQFVLLYLPNDHTAGTRVGMPTPRASVADNDLALGRVVEAVSHSPYWDDTAIFVVEDDAQDGADHVDAHRSSALAISKYSPRLDKPFVDHSFYTTVGMVHTMEDLLGLPPSDVFDAHAPVFAPLFTGPGTQPAFVADDSNLKSGLLFEQNTPKSPDAKKSATLDFTKPDAVDPQVLNAILWDDAVKNGAVKPTPAD